MTLQRSYHYCWKLAKRTGKNFYYSFLTLPRQKHLSMCAIYAWMRLLDDTVDDAPDAQVAAVALLDWEEKTRRALSGEVLQESLWPAFVDTVQRYNIPDAYFFEIIRGAEMDLTIRSYQTFDDLYQYCYRVASVVGLACLHVLEFTHPQAKKHGEWLGIAFQLTNILRDIKEDAERGRIYLPKEDLQAFKVNPREILELHWSEELHDLIESMSFRAEAYYKKAQPVFGMVLPEARPTLEIMSEIYGGILRRLREIDYDVFNHRAGLTLAEKLMVVARRRVRRHLMTAGDVPAPDLTARKIAIVGAGPAGLAAAAALSDYGHAISIFEKKMKLGGRAVWFSDPRHHRDLENPFQLWLNAHNATNRFFSMLGARRYFERHADWRVLIKQNIVKVRPAQWITFPFHWLPALRRLRLSWRESWKVVRGMLRLATYLDEELARLDRTTFQDWLRFHGQGEKAVECFWKPFLGIGIPDRIHRLSTRQVAVFLRQVAACGPLEWYAPTGSTSEIYNDVCRWYLKSRHVKIRTHESVDSVFFGNGQWNVVTGDGGVHQFDEVIVALPPDVLPKIFTPKDYAVLSARTQFDRLGFAPAVLARLEFRQPLFEEPYTLLNKTPFTWGIASQMPRVSSVKRAPFTVTFAGHDARPFAFAQNHDLLKNRVQDIWENILGEGSLPAESEYWCDVDRDFASEPGSFAHRPDQETPLSGLWLAGDWTKTDWPAGLEGSVQSGFVCAEKILAKHGWKTA